MSLLTVTCEAVSAGCDLDSLRFSFSAIPGDWLRGDEGIDEAEAVFDLG